jgi:hypothetical protein
VHNEESFLSGVVTNQGADVRTVAAVAGDRIPILTYHSIDNSGSVVSTTPASFRLQMEALSRSGYRTLTVGQFTDRITAGQWPSEKTVVLTFDDGFENFFTEAVPVLQERRGARSFPGPRSESFQHRDSSSAHTPPLIPI